MPRTKLTGGLTCARCSKPMWNTDSSLPQGQARCRSCRSRDKELLLTATSKVTCERCGTALTEAQRREGGKFCSRRCAYLIYVGSTHDDGRDYKRQRLLGGLRIIDVPRKDTGFPTEPWNYNPAAVWFEGPLRLYWVTRRIYDDGRVEIRCPCCMDATQDVSRSQGWCCHCASLVHVDLPQPRVPKPKPELVQVVAKSCPICEALHTRPIYCSYRCCRTANERRKTARNRKPARTACPAGHPYTVEYRRVRQRMRNGVARTETECAGCQHGWPVPV